MFQKILVAIDTSEMSKLVFAEAVSLAKLSKASIMLLHILSTEEENSPLPIPPDLVTFYPAAGNELTLETWQQEWEQFKREGLELLEKYGEKAKQEGIEAEYQQITGSPGKTICKVALNSKIDLIVIGHRGRTGLSEMFLGSVSNYVLHHAPCSVLMVQTRRT